MRLAADAGERAADDEVGPLHRQRVDVREAERDLRVRRPRRVDRAARGIDRREALDVLGADRREAAAGVEPRPVVDQRVDEAAADVDGPGRRVAGGEVERAESVALEVRARVRVVELVERAADVDRGARDCEGVDVVVQDAGQPAPVGGAVVRPDARQAAVRDAVHGGERAGDDDVARAADGRHRHGSDGGARRGRPVVARHARRHRQGCEAGVAGDPRDRREVAADVEVATRDHHRAHHVVGAGVPRGVDRLVGPDVRDVQARLPADLVEVAADEPAAAAVRDGGEHLAALDRRPAGLPRAVRGVEDDAVARERPDVVERAADIDVGPDAGRCLHLAVGHPARVHGGAQVGVRRGGHDPQRERNAQGRADRGSEHGETSERARTARCFDRVGLLNVGRDAAVRLTRRRDRRRRRRREGRTT